MPVDIVIPTVGESVTSGVIAVWHKHAGDPVKIDDVVLDLETDKVTMEVRAPATGVLAKTLFKAGDTVKIGAVVGVVDESASAPTNGLASSTTPAKPPAPAAVPAATATSSPDEVRATPLAKKVAEERGIDLSKVPATGPGQRVREADVVSFAQGGAPAPQPSAQQALSSGSPVVKPSTAPNFGSRESTRERMTPLRVRLAQRLVEAQSTAAMLTTFNEVDMTAVMQLRAQYKEAFEKKHGIGLGFMSFFVKAAVQALQFQPLVNSYIVQEPDGTLAIQRHQYCDIAVAVAGPKGLVVPVIRNAETLSFAQIESVIKDFGQRAKDGKLTLDEMTGGTFTVSNGGIFGSLMSTPILNPPQSAILGMHAIKNRAVENPERPGELALRPMMYLAMSYDHRIIDGAEAVRFLVKIKECIEDPRRLLLDI